MNAAFLRTNGTPLPATVARNPLSSTFMERKVSSHLQIHGPGLLQGRRSLALGAFFVLVWPTFNVLFTSLSLPHFGDIDDGMMSRVALRIYATFTLAYALILLLQRLFPAALAEEKFWPQLALHVGAILLVGQFFGPITGQLQTPQLLPPAVNRLAFMLFQITLFVLAKTYILQRERHLATQLNLRQTQLNVLRSQSNPHFLFNTLNLLASEIKRDPATAQDIVYDLADLLRESMRAGEHEFISLEEELRLATLYLTLQEKRFPERLEFNIDIEDRCRHLTVPSLILQPVVENVIKHVVARSNSMTSLHLLIRTEHDSLIIQVQDNGPQIDTSSLKPKEGLRLVRETLALHYHGQANMVFESTEDGGGLTITIPLNETFPSNQ